MEVPQGVLRKSENEPQVSLEQQLKPTRSTLHCNGRIVSSPKLGKLNFHSSFWWGGPLRARLTWNSSQPYITPQQIPS